MDVEQTFAPTSLMIIPKMMIHVLLNVCAGFVAMTLDIKDAFLMADQPVEEKAFIKIDDKVFRLLRCLPGQRTAASQWFQMFSQACKEFKTGARCDAAHIVPEARKHVPNGACG